MPKNEEMSVRVVMYTTSAKGALDCITAAQISKEEHINALRAAVKQTSPQLLEDIETELQKGSDATNDAGHSLPRP